MHYMAPPLGGGGGEVAERLDVVVEGVLSEIFAWMKMRMKMMMKAKKGCPRQLEEVKLSYFH